MTQEEKSLLIQDLSARLPYKVKIMFSSNGLSWDREQTLEEISPCEDNDYAINGWGIHGIKPFLRPMSSMTEEESNEYRMFIDYSYNDFTSESTPCVYVDKINEYLDWLNAHHFDYRGLIEKGLALGAPEGMYK